MGEIKMLSGPEPRKVLQTVVEKKMPAIMSYLSRNKWHIAKVFLTDVGANKFSIETSPRKNMRPLNIGVDQPVGISLKYDYCKLIFDTTVVDFEPSSALQNSGKIALIIPDRIEVVQRRKYFRVDVPQSLKVNVMFWHRSGKAENHRVPPESYWQGQLIDLSAGGAQIVVEISQKPDFKKGQFIGLRFTPIPYEKPLMFNAQIRSILPTADNQKLCLGLQIVGLEASPEGQTILRQLCNVVERYYQINQSSVKQQDMQAVHTD